MVNRSYRIGYNFERRVIRHLEGRGYFVTRSGKSKFPDGVAVKDTQFSRGHSHVIIFECKVNKYLSQDEKEKAAIIQAKTGVPMTVFYRDGRKLMSYTLDFTPGMVG